MTAEKGGCFMKTLVGNMSMFFAISPADLVLVNCLKVLYNDHGLLLVIYNNISI